MGHLFGKGSNSIFGGSDSQSVQDQSNRAFPLISQPLQGILGTGATAGTQIADMLGLNGGGAQDAGFQKWKDSTGYQFGLNQGMQSITGNAATVGTLNSGPTLKALNKFGQDYANTQYGNYVNQLQGLLGSGIQGAGALAGAGNMYHGVSNSTQNNQGASGFIGQLLGK